MRWIEADPRETSGPRVAHAIEARFAEMRRGIVFAMCAVVRHLRIAFVIGLVAAASALVAGPASAEKAKKPRAALEAPVLSPRADAALMLRADRVRDLPRGLEAADKKALASAASLLRGDRHEAARVAIERWASKVNGRVSQDDAIFATLWVAREGGVSRLPEMLELADRVRFADERVEVLAMTRAELRNAASTRAGVATFIDVPIAKTYSKTLSPHETRIDRIARDELPARLAEVEEAYDAAVVESDALHAKFAEHEAKNRMLVESVVAIVNAGSRVTRPSTR